MGRRLPRTDGTGCWQKAGACSATPPMISIVLKTSSLPGTASSGTAIRHRTQRESFLHWLRADSMLRPESRSPVSPWWTAGRRSPLHRTEMNYGGSPPVDRFSKLRHLEPGIAQRWNALLRPRRPLPSASPDLTLTCGSSAIARTVRRHGPSPSGYVADLGRRKPNKGDTGDA